MYRKRSFDRRNTFTFFEAELEVATDLFTRLYWVTVLPAAGSSIRGQQCRMMMIACASSFFGIPRNDLHWRSSSVLEELASGQLASSSRLHRPISQTKKKSLIVRFVIHFHCGSSWQMVGNPIKVEMQCQNDFTSCYSVQHMRNNADISMEKSPHFSIINYFSIIVYDNFPKTHPEPWDLVGTSYDTGNKY